MFPDVKTVNLASAELSESEVKYVVDTMWEYTVVKLGLLNVDKVLCEHLGCQARAMHLPEHHKGKKGNPRYILGMDRKFTDMLYMTLFFE